MQPKVQKSISTTFPRNCCALSGGEFSHSTAPTIGGIGPSLGVTEEAASTKEAGTKREIKGKQGDLDVTVEMEQQDSATTKVDVAARKNLAEWDKDYARKVLEAIVKKS